MAYWFVDDSATDNTGTGAWDDPLKYLWKDTGLFSIASPPEAGDTVYVLKGHSELLTTTLIMVSNGTANNPINIVGVDSFNSGSPTTLAAKSNCVVGFASSLGGYDINVNTSGGLCFFQFKLVVGDQFRAGALSNETRIMLENSEMSFLRKGYGFYIGDSSDVITLELRNTDLDFAFTNQEIEIKTFANFIWHGGTLKRGVSTLFKNCYYGVTVDVVGVDLSHADLDYLFGDMSGIAWQLNAQFLRCILSSTVVPFDAAIIAPRVSAVFHSCDTADGQNMFREEYYFGSIVKATNCYQAASSVEFTAKIVSNANTTEYTTPLRFKLSDFYSTANPTLTVEYIHEAQGSGSGGNLQNDEFWIEIEYPDSTDEALGKIDQSNRVATILTTPADQDNSTAIWTENLTGEIKQKSEVTISGGAAGIHTVWVCLAKPSITVYVNPDVTVS